MHLRGRARYAAPIEVLLAQLPTHLHTPDIDTLTAWWTMIEAMASRAGGLRLGIPSGAETRPVQAPPDVTG